MNGFDYTFLNQADHEEIKPYILDSFSCFKPRSSFISKKPKSTNLQLAHDEQPNIVMKGTRFQTYRNHEIAEFEEVFANYPKLDLLQNKFLAIENYASQFLSSCKATFITFSTDLTGAKLGVQHLHPIMNDDRCNVWSFCVPLFLAPGVDQHRFWYNYRPDLYSARYYVDYLHLKKLNLQYSAFEIPKDGKIFSIQFDGARTAHYIDYTQHLYAWFVFDGVTYKNSDHRKEPFRIENI